jgi:membrane protease YdiL (CAAX protease family)
MLIRVAVFYILAFVFTVALGGLQEAAQVSAQTIILAQCGPALAALLMLLIFRKDGLRITFVERRTPAWRYALAFAAPLAGGALVYGVYRLLFATSGGGAESATPWRLLLWLPLGAIGEELGWRGYLHKRLNGSPAGLLSSVLVGALWALWHVGMYPNGALFMVFFVAQMMAYSVIIYALAKPAGFSVALAALFHLGINVAGLFSFAYLNRPDYTLVSSLVWMLIAGAVVLTRKVQFLGASGER